MHDVDALLRNDVVAHIEETLDLDVDACFLPHLANKGIGKRFAFLDPPSGQAPPPRAIRVLVEE
ncbi:hypothetical protein GCM10023405_13660 [Streptomonospora salina]